MGKYEWNAEDYSRHSRAQQKWAGELIDKLDLAGTEDILDLGCGDGKVTAEIAACLRGGSVVGVDNSPSMIELASERYPATEYPNLSFEVMDAVDLSFEERFDIVFSNATLHWVKDHGQVVAGLYRCLRPGGRILLQMGGEGNAEAMISTMGWILASTEWKDYFAGFEFPYGFYGIDDYRELLTRAGFRINRVELIPKEMEHDGKTGLEGWIRTTWLPYTERIPEEKKARFINVVSTQYLKRVPPDSNGKVHVAMVRIEVDATKST